MIAGFTQDSTDAHNCRTEILAVFAAAGELCVEHVLVALRLHRRLFQRVVCA